MRHAKELQRRAQAHGVLDVTESGFVVESGRSGKRYTVTVFGPESVLCSCPWGNHKGTACSHVLSVFRWAAEKLKGRRVSAWADAEEAKRQRHPVQYINDFFITLRKA